MKYFKFSIEQKCIGLGYVYDETKEEAREKILKESCLVKHMKSIF